MLVAAGNMPRVSRHFEAMVVWFNADPAEPGKSYLLKHTSRTVRAKALKIRYRVNVNTLVQEPVDQLQMNDIAYVEFETVSPLFFDPYTQNRITGSFILIDPISNATLGAGMIRAYLSDQTAIRDRAVKPVTATERYKRHRHYPALILVEDNPELAARLERTLFDDHFEVLRIQEADVPFSVLASQFHVFESSGVVLIYSCATIDPETKQKLKGLAGNRLFDLSALQPSDDDSNSVRGAMALLQALRAVKD
jgi:bifunctional enzyme CysN/CysC/sulfate adenylyltransferase subunit 1